MNKIKFLFALFVSFTILFDASVSATSFNDPVTHVVQREGRQTTFSCPLPPDDAWSGCRFQHHDASEGQCSVFNRDGGTFQKCGAFGEAELQATDGVCQLVLTTVTNDHNGTWSCGFTEGKQRQGLDIFEGTKDVSNSGSLGTFAKDFTLMILHEPSAITVEPYPGSGYNYFLMQWFKATITVENVAPKPNIQWTMDNQSIDGLSIKQTEVNYIAQDMEVVERLQFTGKEAFDGKHLQYRLTLEVVDEFGNSTEDYVNEGKIKLNCIGCPHAPPTTTSTTETSATPTLTSSATTNSFTSTTTPIKTTTTSKATTPSTQPTSTTEPTPMDCNFNMTDMSGPLHFPNPGIICKQDPSPFWTIHINCDGNCIDTINVNLNSMHYSSGDPCETRLKITTSSGNGDQLLCFNETTPLKLSFKEMQVNLELENLSTDDPVSFEGEYYFSE